MKVQTSSPAGRVTAALLDAGLVREERAREVEDVVGRVLGGPGPEVDRSGARSRMAEIAGYVGGALVVAAASLVLSTTWGDLSTTARVVTLLVLALVLATAGVVTGRASGGFRELRHGGDDVRRRLVSALFTGAAAAAAMGVATFVDEVNEGWVEWPSLAAGATLLLVAAASYRPAPSALGQLAAVAGALIVIVSAVDRIPWPSGGSLAMALGLLAVGASWAVLTEAGILEEPIAGRFLAVALLLSGAQFMVVDHPKAGYALTFAVALGGFWLYLRTVSWPYLVAGVLGVTIVVTEAVMDWTDGSLGVAGGVLVAGLTLLAASAAGLRAKREATD